MFSGVADRLLRLRRGGLRHPVVVSLPEHFDHQQVVDQPLSNEPNLLRQLQMNPDGGLFQKMFARFRVEGGKVQAIIGMTASGMPEAVFSKKQEHMAELSHILLFF